MPRAGAPAASTRESSPPPAAFPGCTARRVPRSEIDTWDRLEMVREILGARGIVVSDQGLARVPEIDVTSDDAVVRPPCRCPRISLVTRSIRRGG